MLCCNARCRSSKKKALAQPQGAVAVEKNPIKEVARDFSFGPSN